MINAIKQEIIVRQSGVVEIRSPELIPGMLAEVVILLKNTGESQPRRLTSLIGTGKGGFGKPENADKFIRKERDRWVYPNSSFIRYSDISGKYCQPSPTKRIPKEKACSLRDISEEFQTVP